MNNLLLYYGSVDARISASVTPRLPLIEIFIIKAPKGQLISKCLFGVFTFFQKPIENKSTSSKVEFDHSFFGRNVSLKKSFRICLTFSENTHFSGFFFNSKFSSTITMTNAASIAAKKLGCAIIFSLNC